MKNGKPENNRKPWKEWEITLVLTTIPSKYNRISLATILKRKPTAIDFIWWNAYGTDDKSKDKVVSKIKKQIGIPDTLIWLTRKQHQIVRTTTPEGWKTLEN